MLSSSKIKKKYFQWKFSKTLIKILDQKNSEILYLVSTYYNKNSEVTINWRDPDLSINWPIKPKLISAKDLNGINFKEINKF